MFVVGSQKNSNVTCICHSLKAERRATTDQGLVLRNKKQECPDIEPVGIKPVHAVLGLQVSGY